MQSRVASGLELHSTLSIAHPVDKTDSVYIEFAFQKL